MQSATPCVAGVYLSDPDSRLPTKTQEKQLVVTRRASSPLWPRYVPTPTYNWKHRYRARTCKDTPARGGVPGPALASPTAAWTPPFQIWGPLQLCVAAYMYLSSLAFLCGVAQLSPEQINTALCPRPLSASPSIELDLNTYIITHPR